MNIVVKNSLSAFEDVPSRDVSTSATQWLPAVRRSLPMQKNCFLEGVVQLGFQ